MSHLDDAVALAAEMLSPAGADRALGAGHSLLDTQPLVLDPFVVPSTIMVNGRERRVYARPLSEFLGDPALRRLLEIVVPRLVAAGRVTMMGAREKTGKSTFACAAGAAVSRGGTFFGEPVTQGRVLHVGLEEAPADALNRYERMDGDLREILLVEELPLEGRIEQLVAEVEAVMPRLVVIDSLAKLYETVEDENGSTTWTRALAPLIQVARRTNAGVLILHHANKGDGSYRGSTAIGANMDMIVEMRAAEGDETVRTMAARGRWPLTSYRVRLDVDTLTYHLAGADLSPEEARNAARSALRERVLDAVRRAPHMGKVQIREAVGGNAAACDAALAQLVTDGAVRHLGNKPGQGYVADAQSPAQPAEPLLL